MKKTVFLFVLIALMVGVTNVTVFAHGHGRSHRAVQQQPRYAVCTVEGCTLYGIHEHNGAYYNCAPHSETHRHHR